MVEVTIADIVPRERKDEESGRSYSQNMVLLLDKEGRRLLPVWMGPWEATSIALGLKQVDVPRPLTYSFMARLIEAAGAELEEARVEALKGDTFYGVAKVRIGAETKEIDARPSDVIALAVHVGSPIYVAEEVIATAGVPIPYDVEDLEPKSEGIRRILEELEVPVYGLRVSNQPPTEAKRDEWQQKRLELKENVASYFGTEGETEDESSADTP